MKNMIISNELWYENTFIGAVDDEYFRTELSLMDEFNSDIKILIHLYGEHIQYVKFRAKHKVVKIEKCPTC